MKYLIILLLFLSSCSADYHIRRAKFKQPNIFDQWNDTIQLTDVRLDTIFYNDTFQLVKTITKRDTIIQTRYLAPQTRYETRWKYKTIRDTVRIKERTTRVEARQENRTERTRARRWVLIIIAAIAGFIVGFWINTKIKVHL
jgi:hypothetical protein